MRSLFRSLMEVSSVSGTRAMVLGCGLTALLSGCASNSAVQTRSLAKKIYEEPSQAQVLYTEASRRAAYFADKDKPLRFCAEPMPDVSLDQTLDTSVDLLHRGGLEMGNGVLSGKGRVSTKGGMIRNQKVVSKELAGRSAAVLLARELLYRLCELGLNFDPSEKAYQAASKNYLKVIDTIQTIADTEKFKAQAEKATAEAAVLEVAAINQLASEQRNLSIGHATKIMSIVTKTENGKCSIIPEKLDATFKDKIFDGMRDGVKQSSKSCEEFYDLLMILQTKALEQIQKAAEAVK